MTITLFPGASSSSLVSPDATNINADDPSSSPDLATLNLSRLLTRLEHNLLSPAADLKLLRRSEYQRMRVGGNIEYARSLLLTLERNLPQIKPVDRRHEIQTELTKQRQVLNSLREKLDDISADAELKRRLSGVGSVEAGETVEVSSSDEEEGYGEDLLGTPEGTESTSDAGLGEGGVDSADAGEVEGDAEGDDDVSDKQGDNIHLPPSTTATLPTIPTTTPTTTTTTSTLRNRHHPPPSTTTHTKPLPTPTPPEPIAEKDTERTLATHRQEQESLTDSLLTLATQLKTSTQTFHSTLESEKSVLDRAADGIDRTTSSMASAERRMGTLRRMTEGKGWWGRMMLYAWIFGLWIVALGIVFLGPKIR